jgi:hypothetical protein
VAARRSLRSRGVRRRGAIRVLAFVGLLVAMPIAMRLAQARFPSEAGPHGIPALACLLVYVACAAALRSRVIAGVLAGILIWGFIDLYQSFDPEQWEGQLLLWSGTGFMAGLLWEGISRAIAPDLQGTDRDRGSGESS